MALINFNTLQSNNFKFVFKRLEELPFFVKTVNLPGITLGSTQVETPLLAMPQAGDKITYNELNVEFIVDEELKNYIAITSWIKQLGFETSYQNYDDLLKNSEKFSDANLIITNNSEVPIVNVFFKDIFPISVDDISFSVDEDIPVQISATFRFSRWSISSII